MAHLERIEAVNPMLNAIVTLSNSAMDSARDAEAAVMRRRAKRRTAVALLGAGPVARQQVVQRPFEPT